MKKIIYFGFVVVLFLFVVGCSNDVVENNDIDNYVEEVKEKSVTLVEDFPVKDEIKNPKEDPRKEERNSEESSSLKVYINGNKLTQSQIDELIEVYAVPPQEGEYWYDSVSGSYGVWHGQSLGLLLPGHDFGQLPEDASNGNTGVFINGREINDDDYMFLWAVFGVEPIQGRWWLNYDGNIGVKRDPTPLVNLYLAISQAGGGSSSSSGSNSGGSGDNYWAGNFNSYGNEQGGFGYVMVDGASVTYGG